MSDSIPEGEPEYIVQGTTVQWTKTLSNYSPSDGWTLTYEFVEGASSPDSFQIVATDVNGTFTVDVDEATTANYTPANYYYQGFVSDGTDRFAVVSGQMEVIQDYADTPEDPRPWQCVALEALQASISGTPSQFQLSYTIDGIAVSQMSSADKQSWYNFLDAACKNLENDNDLENGRKTDRSGFISFTPVT